MNYFSAQDLLNRALQIAGSNHFEDRAFIPALEQFVSGINSRSDLIPDRKQPLEKDILRLLVNRLWWEKDRAENPDILEQTLLPPVVIAGLPRCGTTKLQRILSASGSFQNMLYWQAHMSSRIPGEANGGISRRIEETQAFCDWQHSVSPGFQTSHALAADLPEEEVFLMNATFDTVHQALGHNAPGYLHWLAGHDLTYCYDYLYRQLQYLQWQLHRGSNRRWLLKTPGHLGNEPQLVRLFPEGLKIICPHREPSQMLPSIGRLCDEAFKCFYNVGEDKQATGQFVLDIFAAGLQKNMAWRDGNTEVEILDLSFTQIRDDAVGAAEIVYDFLGEPLTPEIKKSIQAWETTNPQHKHGKARYSLEEFGLTEEQVNTAYAEYRQRFASYL